jgi:hypothetical protein
MNYLQKSQSKMHPEQRGIYLYAFKKNQLMQQSVKINSQISLVSLIIYGIAFT